MTSLPRVLLIADSFELVTWFLRNLQEQGINIDGIPSPPLQTSKNVESSSQKSTYYRELNVNVHFLAFAHISTKYYTADFAFYWGSGHVVDDEIGRDEGGAETSGRRVEKGRESAEDGETGETVGEEAENGAAKTHAPVAELNNEDEAERKKLFEVEEVEKDQISKETGDSRIFRVHQEVLEHPVSPPDGLIYICANEVVQIPTFFMYMQTSEEDDFLQNIPIRLIIVPTLSQDEIHTCSKSLTKNATFLSVEYEEDVSTPGEAHTRAFSSLRNKSSTSVYVEKSLHYDFSSVIFRRQEEELNDCNDLLEWAAVNYVEIVYIPYSVLTEVFTVKTSFPESGTIASTVEPGDMCEQKVEVSGSASSNEGDLNVKNEKSLASVQSINTHEKEVTLTHIHKYITLKNIVEEEGENRIKRSGLLYDRGEGYSRVKEILECHMWGNMIRKMPTANRNLQRLKEALFSNLGNEESESDEDDLFIPNDEGGVRSEVASHEGEGKKNLAGGVCEEEQRKERGKEVGGVAEGGEPGKGDSVREGESDRLKKEEPPLLGDEASFGYTTEGIAFDTRVCIREKELVSGEDSEEAARDAHQATSTSLCGTEVGGLPSSSVAIKKKEEDEGVSSKSNKGGAGASNRSEKGTERVCEKKERKAKNNRFHLSGYSLEGLEALFEKARNAREVASKLSDKERREHAASVTLEVAAYLDSLGLDDSDEE